MDILYAHLHRWMAEPFVWGKSDCMLVLADYLIALGFPDAAAKWRGQYDSALSCQRVSGFLQNPAGVMGEAATSIGLPETDSPERGDVGVVRIRDQDGIKLMGAVCLGKNWALKGEYTVVICKPLEILAAWKVDRA